MTVSQEDREYTAKVLHLVFRCDSGCGAEISWPLHFSPERHPSQNYEFEQAGWFEVVSTISPGPIFCSWRCVATYAAKASETDR